LDTSPIPNIVRVIKSRGMKWTQNVVVIGKVIILCTIFIGKSEGKGDRGMDGKILLKTNLTDMLYNE
jgi:hypothetical protein